MGATAKVGIQLPNWYQSGEIEFCDEAVSVDLGPARWLARREQALGRRPVTVFRNIVEYPEACVLGNPYTYPVMLRALRLPAPEWQTSLWQRLHSFVPSVKLAPEPWRELSDLQDLPALKHRPGDEGRYITSGVTVCRSPETGHLNLGVYRIQIVGPRKARIFFDPRTDAHRNWAQSISLGESLPVTIFIGAHPGFILAAASRLPADKDDFEFVSRLVGCEISIAGEPPAPVDASYVIRGRVTAQMETEGPFAEFKGYYVDARQSPVLEVDSVQAGPAPLYPMIVTGAESGLTLMSFQNEYLMFCELRDRGFPIRQVRYPLEARSEFLALLESDSPTVDLLRAALHFDRRAKIVICGRSLRQPWDALATNGLDVLPEPYYRKGVVEGERVGIILNRPPQGRPVEY